MNTIANTLISMCALLYLYSNQVMFRAMMHDFSSIAMEIYHGLTSM